MPTFLDPCIMTTWSKGGPVKVTFGSIEQKSEQTHLEKKPCEVCRGIKSYHTIKISDFLRNFVSPF